MIQLFFDSLIGGMVEWTGSALLTALLIMALFLGLAMLLGLPFDFALLLTSPIPYALQGAGYLDVWISGLIIVVVIGFSIYLIWTRFQDKR